MRLILALLVTAAATAPRASAAEVSLPLRGYYRVGEYFPLRVSGAETEPTVELRGEGLLPVRLTGAANTIVPMLVLDRPGAELTVAGKRVPVELRELSADERLVGTIGTTEGLPDGLFAPDKKIVRLPLDRDAAGLPPLYGRAIAWEALDAVVADVALPEAAGPEVIATLLGRGVTLAVRADLKPDARWPWRQQGRWWVMRHDPVGPASAVAPAAYAPVAGWSPGLSHTVRTRVVAAAVLIAIADLAAVLLLPRRLGLPGVLIVTAAAAVTIPAWAARQKTLARIEGDVVTRTGELAQMDSWSYLTDPRDATWTGPWTDADVRPMLASPEHAARMDMTLECFGDRGPQRLTARLQRNLKLAVLTRSLGPWKPPRWGITSEVNSPMRALINEAYLAPGVRVVGQEPAKQTQQREMPTVVLEKRRGGNTE